MLRFFRNKNKLETLLEGATQPLAIALARVDFAEKNYDDAAKKLSPYIESTGPFTLPKSALALYIACKDRRENKETLFKELERKNRDCLMLEARALKIKDAPPARFATVGYDRDGSAGRVRIVLAPM